MSLTKEIIDGLFNKFDKHKYLLANSFVYKWESDFFSQLASGYHQEVEVKVTRSDYLADFKKEEKHMVLQKKFDGAKTICFRYPPMYKVERHEKVYLRDKDRRRIFDENGLPVYGKSEKTTIFYTSNTEPYKWEVSRELAYTTVYFKDVHCPNRFYYCCPVDLISPEEVPEYAGLMYYDGGRFKKVKNAPLIHKEKRNLSQVLLDKFYHKYLYSR